LFPDRRRFFLAIAAASLAASFPLPLLAQSPKATAEVPMLDPWLPPAVRKELTVAPAAAEGAALRAQVERKLRDSFDAAARDSNGALTREQARSAGLGFIANHFDAIDRRGAGVVRFEDYKRFLKERGAALD
jgi:hypothetical protein